MIARLQLNNFRGFRDHTVTLAPFCLLVGQNNAGKTTIIEALRIISAAQARAATANFIPAPNYLTAHVTGPVYRISLNKIEFEHKTAHHRYEASSPAVITAHLKNNCRISVYIGEEEGEVFCQLIEANGQKVFNRSHSSSPKFDQTIVMPTIGQLVARERRLTDTYLKQNLNSRLAHRHIRNQMLDNPKQFRNFKDLAERSWEKLQIKRVYADRDDDGTFLSLQVRDGPFVSEIGLQGSGLQAWIQTIWFLARVGRDSCVVIDEPDVYLHADLQRKLVKVLGSSGFRQVIVATHSVEMISDVATNEIVLVRKGHGNSKPIANPTEAQLALDEIGTLHNLQLSKLSQSGRVLFVEGKDHALLSEIAFKLGPSIYDRFSLVPSFPIQGFENWPRAALAAKVFSSASGGRIKSYLVLDRDYRSDAELAKIRDTAAKSDLTVLNWRRKEIENYFVSYELIYQFLAENASVPVTVNEIRDKLEQTLEDLGKKLPALVAESFRSANRSLDVPAAMELAEQLIAERMNEGCKLRDLVSGKRVLSVMADYANATYNTSFAPMTLCRAMKRDRIPQDMEKLVENLCQIA
jgi:predicted ATP-dependent endonuclease of OLD family